jgi:hypothetical protein
MPILIALSVLSLLMSIGQVIILNDIKKIAEEPTIIIVSPCGEELYMEDNT